MPEMDGDTLTAEIKPVGSWCGAHPWSNYIGH